MTINKSTPKRVLLKLSGEALQGKNSYGIDVDFLNDLAKKIISIKDRGIEVVLVFGGGNIFRGAELQANGMDRANGDYMGMLATVMNGIAMVDAIEKLGTSARLMSAFEISRVSELFIRRRAMKHLEKGRVVICVAGTGNPYATTDSAAVLRALEMNCDYMIKGTKVDGVYDKDPMKNDDAVRYDEIKLLDALKKGVRVMDQQAIALANEEKMPIFVCKIEEIDSIGTTDMNGTFVIP